MLTVMCVWSECLLTSFAFCYKIENESYSLNCIIIKGDYCFMTTINVVTFKLTKLYVLYLPLNAKIKITEFANRVYLDEAAPNERPRLNISCLPSIL